MKYNEHLLLFLHDSTKCCTQTICTRSLSFIHNINSATISRDCLHVPEYWADIRGLSQTWVYWFSSFCFNSRGIVHKEFLPPGQTVNRAFYKDILEPLLRRIQRVGKDIAGDWVLHDDNAPAHIALSIRDFLAKKNILTLPHSPYSPDLAPCDFCLLSKLKSKLKGHHFGTVETIRKSVTDWARNTQRKWFPVLLLSMERKLEPPRNFLRVVFWRR
jgi:histone-lysine N-methyltransferase SETMAR